MEIVDRSKGQWFILQVLTGQESRVREKLECQIRMADASMPVYEAIIPMEKVSEFKNGKKHTITRKIFPGYVYVRMDLYNEDGVLNEKPWYFVREVQGVISFLGGGEHPLPLSDSEVAELMGQIEREQSSGSEDLADVPSWIDIGNVVRITDGAFAGFEGKISEIDRDHGRLKLEVSIFGRDTPVELEFRQVGERED